MNKKLILVIALAISSVILASHVYSSVFPESYEQKTAQEKRDFIWGKALADNGQPAVFPSDVSSVGLITPVAQGGLDLAPVGNNESDENAPDRVKYIHSVAKSAKIIFKFEANPFTGAFAETTCIGVMRASSATKPIPSQTAPGISVKIFRDKVPSGNFVAMWDLFGQDNDTNFFSHPFSNHVNALPSYQFGAQYLQLKILVNKFSGYDVRTNMVGLSDLAKFKNDGTAVASPKAPFALVFKPNPSLTTFCRDAPLIGENFGCFQQIAKGTLLYTIYYVEEPVAKSDVTGSTLKLQGTMTSDSGFISSKFMDQTVQFRHVLWDEEVKTLDKEEWNTKLDDTFMREDGASKWADVL